MPLLRLLIVAVAVALGTTVFGWWTVPVIAVVYGVVARNTTAPGWTAAAGAALAWGGYLSVLAFGGAPIGRFGGELAQAMAIPSWGPHVATMLFPALIAGPAAWLASRFGSRRPEAKPVRPRR